MGFTSLQAAYDAALTGETIMLKGGALTGTLVANKAINVIIRGGYEATYTINCATTKIKSRINVRTGTVKFEGLSIAY